MVEKTYKELKEAWVTGHTGGSVADVNSVSLAMPVLYTLFKIVQRAQLTVTPAEHFFVVCLAAAASIVHTIHACRLLRRFSAQLRCYTMRNDHLLLFALDSQFSSATSSSRPIGTREASRNQTRYATTPEEGKACRDEARCTTGEAFHHTL